MAIDDIILESNENNIEENLENFARDENGNLKSPNEIVRGLNFGKNKTPKVARRIEELDKEVGINIYEKLFSYVGLNAVEDIRCNDNGEKMGYHGLTPFLGILKGETVKINNAYEELKEIVRNHNIYNLFSLDDWILYSDETNIVDNLENFARDENGELRNPDKILKGLRFNKKTRDVAGWIGELDKKLDINLYKRLFSYVGIKALEDIHSDNNGDTKSYRSLPAFLGMLKGETVNLDNAREIQNILTEQNFPKLRKNTIDYLNNLPKEENLTWDELREQLCFDLPRSKRKEYISEFLKEKYEKGDYEIIKKIFSVAGIDSLEDIHTYDTEESIGYHNLTGFASALEGESVNTTKAGDVLKRCFREIYGYDQPSEQKPALNTNKIGNGGIKRTYCSKDIPKVFQKQFNGFKNNKESAEELDDSTRENFDKGNLFEQLTGLILKYLNPEQTVVPQYCLQVDDKTGYFGNRIDFKVGKEVFEVKVGSQNSHKNIEETIEKQFPHCNEFSYNLVTMNGYSVKEDDNIDKNVRNSITQINLPDLVEDSSLFKEVLDMLNDRELTSEQYTSMIDFAYTSLIEANNYKKEQAEQVIEKAFEDLKTGEYKNEDVEKWKSPEAHFEYEGTLYHSYVPIKEDAQDKGREYQAKVASGHERDEDYETILEKEGNFKIDKEPKSHEKPPEVKQRNENYRNFQNQIENAPVDFCDGVNSFFGVYDENLSCIEVNVPGESRVFYSLDGSREHQRYVRELCRRGVLRKGKLNQYSIEDPILI